ncbi:hypothetical protein GcC1_148026 [Golovinomyces cichoracearum]|uniref:Uncharacterized protein n=1 Tax=Golovinomyces cichoracearum TaxID=62708 RepID=A0A420HY35_9PEZI|nr:hypothetical protein GcC1_148026 [Golovinomyces cichoracearum]
MSQEANTAYEKKMEETFEDPKEESKSIEEFLKTRRRKLRTQKSLSYVALEANTEVALLALDKHRKNWLSTPAKQTPSEERMLTLEEAVKK